MITLAGTAMLYRYKCNDCEARIYLPDFKNSATMMCPICAKMDPIYDREIEILLEKGKSKRKVRYFETYKNSTGKEFYLDKDEFDKAYVKHDAYGEGRISYSKDLQHFGLKRSV